MAKSKAATATDEITDAGLGEELAAPKLPKPLKHVSDDEPKPPPFETPTVISAAGPLPRLCKPTDRVPKGAGISRYKIACRNYTPQPTRYVVAQDEDSAVDCYLRSTKLHDTITRLKKRAGANADEVEAPELAITVLED